MAPNPPPAATPGAPVVEGFVGIEVIGRGASATVYRARQVDFDRTVALKVLHVDLGDPRAQRRFTRERQLSGRLGAHPNIATVFDAGFVDRRYPYLAMEHFELGSLADRLDERGPLAVADVLHHGVRLAGALESAHAAGILHRDVKPQNVLLSRFGEPVLADFGIATVAEAEQSVTGAFTPVHAAPELLEGGQPTAAADVYALGSTLHTLLAGTAPFAGPPGESVLAQLLRITTSDIPPLLRDDVPPTLVEVLRRSMAKRPEERTATAAELGRGLQRVEADLGLPVTALPLERADAGAPGPTRAAPDLRPPPPTPAAGHRPPPPSVDAADHRPPPPPPDDADHRPPPSVDAADHRPPPSVDVADHRPPPPPDDADHRPPPPPPSADLRPPPPPPSASADLRPPPPPPSASADLRPAPPVPSAERPVAAPLPSAAAPAAWGGWGDAGADPAGTADVAHPLTVSAAQRHPAAPTPGSSPRGRGRRAVLLGAAALGIVVAALAAVALGGGDGDEVAGTTTSSATTDGTTTTTAPPVDPGPLTPTDVGVATAGGAVVVEWADATGGERQHLVYRYVAGDDPVPQTTPAGEATSLFDDADPAEPACYQVVAVVTATGPDAVVAPSELVCTNGAEPSSVVDG